MQERTAAVVSGFAPVTVSILKKDPAFAALVKFYETEKGKGFDYVRAQILGGRKFIEEMERRVTDPAGAREFPSEGGGAYPAQPGAALFPPKAAPD